MLDGVVADEVDEVTVVAPEPEASWAAVTAVLSRLPVEPKLVPPPMYELPPAPSRPCHWKPMSAALVASTVIISAST